jgi:hypothetical protein
MIADIIKARKMEFSFQGFILQLCLQYYNLQYNRGRPHRLLSAENWWPLETIKLNKVLASKVA